MTVISENNSRRRRIMLSTKKLIMLCLLGFHHTAVGVDATIPHTRKRRSRKNNRELGIVEDIVNAFNHKNEGKGSYKSTKSPSASPSLQPSPSPSEAPSPSPTSSRQPSPAPSESPTRAPTNPPTNSPTRPPTLQPTPSPSASPSASPSEQPSLSPTPQPSMAPSTSYAPTDSPAPTGTGYERVQEVNDNGDTIYLTRCGLAEEIPVEAGPVVQNVIAFRYEMTVADSSIKHADKIPSIEEKLNGYLSRIYMSECNFQNSDFQVYSMSSEPVDTVGTVCESDVSCRVIDGYFTTQTFYMSRRLQNGESFSDPVLAEQFAATLTDLMGSGDLSLDDSDISSLEFVGFTNFVSEGQSTFGGVDPGQDSAVAASKRDPSEFGKSKVSWASAVLGISVVALIATVFIVVRRRRNEAKSLSRTHLEDEERYTFDDGLRLNEKIQDDEAPIPGYYVDTYEPTDDAPISPLQDTTFEEASPPSEQQYVLNDLMTDTGTEVPYEVSSYIQQQGSILQENTNPPVFISTAGMDPDRSMEDLRNRRYDPYGRPYTTPDTVDF